MAFVTLDETKKGAGITLSGRTASYYSADGLGPLSFVATTKFRDSGKWYFEVVLNNTVRSGGDSVGAGVVGNAAQVNYDGWMSDYSEWVYFNTGKFQGGAAGVLFNGSPAYLADTVYGFALDLDAGKFWVSINGVWQNGGDPAAGTSPAVSNLKSQLYSSTAWSPAIQLCRFWNDPNTTNSMTFKGLQDELTYDPPVGFAPYDDALVVDLVLTSPYTTPTDNLLVLRSRPDVDPIDGTADLVEAHDAASVDAVFTLPPDQVIGTFAITCRADTAQFTGVMAPRDATGTLAVTGANDTATIVGNGFIGFAERIGVLASVGSGDTASIEAVNTPKWVGVIDATEPGDAVTFSGAFLEYTGPGFLNSTERKDTAQFSGTIVYDVAGTIEITERADAVTIIARTLESVEAESTDTVTVFDFADSTYLVSSLLSRVVATDVLEYSRDMVFADTVNTSETLTGQLNISQSRSDTVYVIDELDGQAWGVSIDTVNVSDVLNVHRLLVTADSVDLTESLVSSLTISDSFADGAVVTDSVVMAIDGIFAEDAISFSDTIESEYSQAELQSDLVVAAESLSSSLAASAALSDIEVLTDELGIIWLANSEDSVLYSDVLDSPVSATAGLTDSVSFADELLGTLTVYAPLLTDAVTYTDVLESVVDLQLAGVLSDVVLAGDALYEAAQTVYVVNAETGAVSTYQFTPMITGMASYQGVLYLAGPEGLYALDAEQDDDGNVVWTLRTGFSNLGTDKLKRVRDVNFQARTEADLTFQVVSDRYGFKQEWNYRLPPLTRDSYRDGVVKPGLGVQSVYWQFAAEGIGPAEIDQLRLSVEPLSRRR